MHALKWALLALYGMAAIRNVIDCGKHGKPRTGTHEAPTSAAAACVDVAIIAWILWVMP